MKSPFEMKLKIFADGADKQGMLEMYANPLIRGFTTNPTLMRKAGISNYESFAREILAVIRDRPISLEVFSDDFADMARQARKIASWGSNVYVKIPVTNTHGKHSTELVQRLAGEGIQLNVTAILTLQDVQAISDALRDGPPSYISVFAGRIADTGVDPVPVMAEAVSILSGNSNQELIWASPRELLNIVQAECIGCHVITVSNDILKKLPILGKELAQLSLETVQMFHRDATAAGYTI